MEATIRATEAHSGFSTSKNLYYIYFLSFYFFASMIAANIVKVRDSSHALGLAI
jgi:hypothetical protein